MIQNEYPPYQGVVGKKPTSLCARWDTGQLGQNGVIDEEDVEGDDMEESEADAASSDQDEQSHGDEDEAVVDMEN